MSNPARRSVARPPRDTQTATSPARVTGEDFTRRAVTTILALIAALTFLFCFGNVWTLGLRLGVPRWVAPLVGPAVDLSVVGLLVGVRYLALCGASRRDLRPARLLLVFCGTVTLALNVAEPVAQAAYGRAAFDAVGPLLLLGWSEVGPALLRQINQVREQRQPAAERDAQPAGAEGARRTRRAGSQRGGIGRRASGTAESLTAAGELSDQVGDEPLLVMARRIDRECRSRHGRPASADILRHQLRIGSARARAIARILRAASGIDEPPSSQASAPGVEAPPL